MAKKHKSSFRGKITKNTQDRKKSNSFGHFDLPSGIEMLNPEPDTKILIDFLPYTVTTKNHPDKNEEAEIATKGSLWYKRPYKVHRQVGAKNEMVVCPTSIGKPCPICEFIAKLKKEDADEDQIKSLKPSDRNEYAVMLLAVTENKKTKKVTDKKVAILDFSDWLFQKEFEDQLGDHENFDTFPDHIEGCSVRITFAEATFAGNKYAKPTRFDFVEREEPYDDEILEQVPNLDDLLIIMDYDELKNKFFEVAGDEDEDEDEDEKPKKSSRKKVVDEDEEDDDIDELEEEDEEEEEKPVKKSRKKVQDDDEDEAPKKRSKELKCPHKHTFGKDTDRYDDCEDCEIWNECLAAKKRK